jgi:hypothetical protein
MEGKGKVLDDVQALLVVEVRKDPFHNFDFFLIQLDCVFSH